MPESRWDVIVDPSGAVLGSRKASTAISGVGTRAQTSGRAVDQMDEKTRRLGRTLRRVGGLAAGVLAFGGISAGIRGTISTISDFESTLALTGAVAGIDQTSEAFARLNATARNLGATTRFSANEAGEGLLFLARAGFSTDDAIGALPNTLNLAAAGAISLGEAADVASNIGSTFAKEFGGAVNATNVAVDTLVATSNRTNTSVAQLAEALKFAGPTAASFGVGMNEASAALGQLGNFGIQASLAGTNLRGVLAGLVDVSDKGEAALRGIGLTVEDLDPKTNSLADIFEKLRDAGFGAEEALALFGKRNASAALIFAQTTNEMRELTGELENAEGEAQRIADVMNDTLKGAFLSLKSAIQEVALQIGEAGFGGGLRAVVDQMTNLIRYLFNIRVAGQEFSATTVQLAEGLRAVAGGIAAIIGLKLALWFGAALTALRAFTVAALSNPFGALAAAVGLLVGALIRFRNTQIEVFDTSFTLTDVLVATWEHVKDRFVFYFRAITEIGAFAWRTLKEGFMNAYDAIVDNLNEFLGPWKGLLDTLWTNLRSTVKNIVRYTKASVIALVRSLGTVIDEFVTKFSAIGKSLVTALNPNAGTLDRVRALANLSGTFGTLGQESGDKFSMEFAKALENDTSIFDAFAELRTKSLDDLQNFFDANSIDLNAEDFERFLTPYGAARDIARRIKELSAERAAILERQKDTVEETTALLVPFIGLSGSILNVVSVDEEERLKAINAEIAKLTSLDEDGQEETFITRLQDQVSTFGSTLKSTLFDLFSGVTTLGDAFKDLGRQILEAALQAALLDPLTDSLSGLFSGGGGGGGGGLFGSLLGSLFGSQSAKGNAFIGGRVQTFAKGGIIDDTAIFPMSGGGIGVAGEAGPEVRLPIGRDRTGDLTVGASGMAGTTVNLGGITVVSNTPDEFRDSMRSVANSARRMLDSAMRS